MSVEYIKTSLEQLDKYNSNEIIELVNTLFFKYKDKINRDDLLIMLEKAAQSGRYYLYLHLTYYYEQDNIEEFYPYYKRTVEKMHKNIYSLTSYIDSLTNFKLLNNKEIEELKKLNETIKEMNNKLLYFALESKDQNKFEYIDKMVELEKDLEHFIKIYNL